MEESPKTATSNVKKFNCMDFVKNIT